MSSKGDFSEKSYEEISKLGNLKRSCIGCDVTLSWSEFKLVETELIGVINEKT